MRSLNVRLAYVAMWDMYSQNNHQDNKVPPNPVRHSVGT